MEKQKLIACRVCGKKTDRYWCCRAHHMEDEPGAYNDDRVDDFNYEDEYVD